MILLLATPLVLALLAALAFWRTAGRFSDYRAGEPSRLYGRAWRLRAEERVDGAAFAAHLVDQGYTAAGSALTVAPGSFAQIAPGDFLIARRPAPNGPDLPPSERLAEVRVEGDRVTSLRVGESPVEELEIDPPLLASYYGPDMRECRPVDLDRLPPHVIQAVLAAEDDRFFSHQGISPTSVVRAALVNLVAGRVRQGGSTITQQLARTLYLTRQRTWARKSREALLSLALEMRYSKRELLGAYLNEAYWGRSGAINLIGIGAAAQTHFGKPAERLDVGQAALLAGMIRSPGDYDPSQHPQQALARRNHVLRRMADLGWVGADLADQAARRPLGLAPQSLPVYGEVGYFADAMAEEARDRFRISDLAGRGYALLSTLDRRDQRRALAALADRATGAAADQAPQAALVSLDPADGSILAWVGGRDYAANQFDRVRNAHRQAGSAFKPVVYAAALRAGANLTDPIVDSPIVVRRERDEWRPHNDDSRYRGEVSVRAAMEQSLNIPTVRLALAAGLESVRELGGELGVELPDDDNPSIALGTVDVTPLELARVYATLASGGLRPTPFGLQRVVDSSGRELPGLAREPAARILDEPTAFLLTSLLEGVVTRGTGAGVRRLGLRGALAGKTGTSDDGRDGWFAGYTRDRVTVVWVGRDDNQPAGLKGSRTALPIWARFMSEILPASGESEWTAPEGVSSAEIDPETGALATPFCPQRRRDYFYASRVPVFSCPLHSSPTMWAGLDVPAGAFGGFQPTSYGSGQRLSGSQTVIVLEGSRPGGTLSWIAIEKPLAGPLPATAPPDRPPGRQTPIR